MAAAEDQSEFDLTTQFDTNFMGTLNILQLSLPYFRRNRIAGRYLIFSSTAGALGVPGLAGYCATKYAVEGLIESMLYEVHCFNIRVTLVEPGHVRDDDSDYDLVPGEDEFNFPETGRSSESSPSTRSSETRQSPPGSSAPKLKRYGHFAVKPNPSEPYNVLTSPSGHAKRIFQWLDARQPTSAIRCAELVWQLAHCSYPPLRLLLGNFAVESIRDRLKCVTEEIEDWKFLSFPADGGASASGASSGSQSVLPVHAKKKRSSSEAG